jgi:hypothetical protein
MMKFFIYNGAKHGKIGHQRIGIGLRISGRTFTHTSDKKVRPAHRILERLAHISKIQSQLKNDT